MNGAGYYGMADRSFRNMEQQYQTPGVFSPHEP